MTAESTRLLTARAEAAERAAHLFQRRAERAEDLLNEVRAYVRQGRGSDYAALREMLLIDGEVDGA